MNQENEKNFNVPDEATDEELIRHINHGDQEAFSILYNRHLTSVYNRVAYLIPTNDIEDVTQEVFIQMIRSLPSFRGDAKFSTWLRVITNRQISNYYRKNKKKLEDTQFNQDDSWIQKKSSPNTPSRDTQDRYIIVQQSLMRVPKHYREIVMLRFVEGMKFQEIADHQGRSLDAVKSTFRRAIEAMRNEIGEQHV